MKAAVNPQLGSCSVGTKQFLGNYRKYTVGVVSGQSPGLLMTLLNSFYENCPQARDRTEEKTAKD